MATPKLVYPDGRPIEFERLREEEAGPTVTGVRSIQSGHPAQGLTPQRLGQLLRAAEDGDAVAYLELAEDMEERDLHYRSVLATRKMQVASLEIVVEAASDQPDDVAAADLVRLALNRGSLQLELFDILDAVGKGFSVSEIIWELSEKQWMPRRIEWRDPRWFEFDRVDGRTPLLRGLGSSEPLSPFKYITHVHTSKSGLPIRGGLARAAAWAYLFKNFDIKAWVVFAEAYGHPMRVGKFGPGASEKDKATLLRAVRDIAADAAAIIPQGMEIQFVESKLAGNSTVHRDQADWFDRQVSKAVLGQTGTTDTGQHVGTANAHERVREDIEAFDGMQLGVTLTEQFARPVVDLNMGPRKAYPRIKIFRPNPEDLDGLVDRVAKLVPLGLKVEESFIRDKIGVPDPDEGAQLLGAKSAAPAPIDDDQAEEVAAQAQATNYTERLEKLRDRREGGDAIDDLAAEVLADWEPVADELINPIEQLAEECESYEEFLRRLPELAAKMNPDKLADALARAAFASRLAGETETDLA